MMQKILKPEVLFVIGIFIAIWIPVTVTQIDSPAKNDVKYIRRVFGEHQVGQTLATIFPSHEINLLVRGEGDYPGTVKIRNKHGQEIGRAEIDLTATDAWITIPLKPALPAGNNEITIYTDENIPREQTILVRYQPRSDSYPQGNMIYDGEPSYGDTAFKLNSRLPYWKSLSVGTKLFDTKILKHVWLLLAGLAIGTLIWLIDLRTRSIKKYRISIITISLLALFMAGVLIRAPYPKQLNGLFGGDPFNYLSKTQALLEGKDPFNADPRKGVVYSALLLPSFASSNPLAFSRWLSIFSAAGAVVMLAIVLRLNSLKWGVALGAAIFTAVNLNFIWESPNAMANTLYTLLVLATFAAYLKSGSPNYHWLLAVLLGLTFLTLFEGATFALILIPALWWKEKLRFRRVIALSAITFAIMMIPQLSYLWSGNSGIRSPDDILGDEGLYVIHSMEDVKNNLDRLYTFVDKTWIAPADFNPNSFIPWLVAGLVLGTMLIITRKYWPQHVNRYAIIAGSFLLILITALVFLSSNSTQPYLRAIIFMAIGMGFVSWLSLKPRDNIILTLALLVQILVITAILPKERYLILLIPFFGLWLAKGITSLFTTKHAVIILIPLLIIGLLSSYLFVEGRPLLHERVLKYNSKSAVITPMLNAVTDLRAERVHSGFLSSIEQSAEIFIPTKYRHEFIFKSSDHEKIVARELKFINENEIKFIVEREGETKWRSLRDHPDLFEEWKTYESDEDDSVVRIYSVKQ